MLVSSRHCEKSTKRFSENRNLDWKPIETAPKGWDKMLLLYGKQETHATDGNIHSTSSGTYVYVGCFSDGFGEKWIGGIFWPTHDTSSHRWSVLTPTHWMPLPDAPNDCDVSIS